MRKTQKFEDYKSTLMDTKIQLAILEDHVVREALKTIPESWRFLDTQFPQEPKKTRVTLYLDDPIYKLFKIDGRSWQMRVRAVLRSYSELRIKKYLSKTLPSSGELLADFLRHVDEETRTALIQNAGVRAVEDFREIQLAEALAKLTRAVGEYEQLRQRLLAEDAEYLLNSHLSSETTSQDNGDAFEAERQALLERVLKQKASLDAEQRKALEDKFERGAE